MPKAAQSRRRPAGPPSRLRLALVVVRYALRRPLFVLRHLSWRGLRNLTGHFLGRDGDELHFFVRQRFTANPVALPAYVGGMGVRAGEAVGRGGPGELAGVAEPELRFEAAREPTVSVIVALRQDGRGILTCLEALRGCLHGTNRKANLACEVIIAEEGATDEGRHLGNRVAGVTRIVNSADAGWARASEVAAALARGDYLLFLDGSTAMAPDGLAELLAVLDADESVAITGPMALNANGSLRAAGGIVWRDGSTGHYGRGDDPTLPAYNYRREVDFVPAGCLLMRRSVWDALGGFAACCAADTAAAAVSAAGAVDPGSAAGAGESGSAGGYEVVDMCFAARAAGHRVVYQPHARVHHMTARPVAGEDGSPGQARFQAKWRDTLARDHFPPGEQLFLARDRSRQRRTIVVVDHLVPTYDQDAGSRSTWMYIQLKMEMGYNVKFIPGNFHASQPYTRLLQAMGVEVLEGRKMARGLGRWLRDNAANIDTAYIHRPHVAEQFLKLFEAMKPRPRLLYFGHDLHYLRVQREFEVIGQRKLARQAKRWKSRELNVATRVDKVYFPSQVEVDLFGEVAPQAQLRAIPVYVLDDVETVPYDWSQRRHMLFVGGFNHPPNGDSLHWLVDEIMPRVWAAAPDVQLHVVGSNAPPDVLALASDRVVIHGYLSDRELSRRYALARMAVAPLRYGAGIKGKVVEALQNGVPMITTAIGAEGLPTPEQVFLVADTAADFAAAILAAERGEPEVLARLNRYADYLQRHFSKQVAMDLLREDFGPPHIDRPWEA